MAFNISFLITSLRSSSAGDGRNLRLFEKVASIICLNPSDRILTTQAVTLSMPVITRLKRLPRWMSSRERRQMLSPESHSQFMPVCTRFGRYLVYKQCDDPEFTPYSHHDHDCTSITK